MFALLLRAAAHSLCAAHAHAFVAPAQCSLRGLWPRAEPLLRISSIRPVAAHPSRANRAVMQLDKGREERETGDWPEQSKSNARTVSPEQIKSNVLEGTLG